MTPEHIIKVITFYERRLQLEGIPQKRIDPNNSFNRLSTAEVLSHAHWLCTNAKLYAADKEKEGKANRHLAAIQMCLSFAGWYTLAELMEHNEARSWGRALDLYVETK